MKIRKIFQSDFRRELKSCFEEIEKNDKPIIIIRRKQTNMVVMSLKKFIESKKRK